ncbi:NAD binding domain of 6-phosphogluconate dehydrogenase-domain-containing protein [Phyllosticta citriasiana]|uniref:NAD binding domain of 6-phosphogluconate dehydrogenase-domain-containing protein n=1 Tax=Phyllosticta citriasiana TaxID=595635 RepID=UPI0030FD57F2
MSPQIGFVGLGAMGFGMATNLVKQGYRVKGFDVFPASVQRFQEAGGIAASSLVDSAADSSFYIVMVASADQVQEALFGENGAVKALPHGATLLLCSTVPSSYAESVAKELRDDIFFVDCPVSGGTQRAANGTLTIMAGAEPEALEKAKWLLQEMSDPKSLYVPGGIGAGSNMKMVHQVLAAIQILLSSEAMGFAARLGLDARKTYEAVNKSDTWCWMFENRVPRLIEEDFVPGASAITIILKDAGIITSMARLTDFPTPLSAAAESMYLVALGQGMGRLDDASMVRLYYPEPVKNVVVNEGDVELVFKLLRGVLICAAAEAIGFARFLNLDLHQFHDLAANAAGGSVQFRERGAEMISLLTGQKVAGVRDLPELDIDAVRKDLADAISAARKVNCPTPLASQALSLLATAKRKKDDYYGLL